MAAPSTALSSKELDKLLLDALEKVLGPINPEDPAAKLILSTAKEMVKQEYPDGIPKNIAHYPEVKKFLGETLKAATAVGMHLTAEQDKLKGLLKEHTSISEQLKKNPNDPKLKLDLKNVKAKINESMKNLNALDPNPESKKLFEKQRDKGIDAADEVEKISKMSKEERTPAPNGMDPLTQSLISLYGRDPRVPGSTNCPGAVPVGNEYGIPELTVIAGISDALEDLDNVAPDEQYSKQMEGKTSPLDIGEAFKAISSITDDVMASFVDDAIVNNQQMLSESPGLKPPSPY
jgi:hypothetical protein